MNLTTNLKRAVLGAALLFCASGAVASERITVEIGGSPTLGPADAPVTIVEFIDFQ